MLNGRREPGSGLASFLIGINTLLILESNGTLLRHEMLEIVDHSLNNLESSRLGASLNEETVQFAHVLLGQLRASLCRDRRSGDVDFRDYRVD